jgi:hypothetical protein
VLAFLVGLVEEQFGQQGQLTLLKVRGDTDVLQARAELMADLRVECLRQVATDKHGLSLREGRTGQSTPRA